MLFFNGSTLFQGKLNRNIAYQGYQFDRQRLCLLKHFLLQASLLVPQVKLEINPWKYVFI